MTVLSNRAQLEAQGWKFTAVPRFWAEGVLSHNRQTGWKSPAHYDHKHPEAWVAAPPDGLPICERRFENISPIPAVRWAWEQAKAPRMDASLTGVAALVAMMGAARSSGAVADLQDDMGQPRRPDAELLSLCRDYLGCERIRSKLLEKTPADQREVSLQDADGPGRRCTKGSGSHPPSRSRSGRYDPGRCRNEGEGGGEPVPEYLGHTGSGRALTGGGPCRGDRGGKSMTKAQRDDVEAALLELTELGEIATFIGQVGAGRNATSASVSS